jgi:hypothetical protein
MKKLSEALNLQVNSVNWWYQWLYLEAINYDFRFGEEVEDIHRENIVDEMDDVRVFLFNKFGQNSYIGVTRLRDALLKEFESNSALYDYLKRFFDYFIAQEAYLARK